MRRIVLAVAAVVVLSALPLTADSTAPAATVANPQLPEFLRLTPEAPTPKSCSVSYTCQDGNVISCTGSYSCTVNTMTGEVSCDGYKTICPNRCWLTLWCRCGNVSCISTRGDCQHNGSSITCNGYTSQCECDPPIEM
jgi:hypothetical protein